ncbi:MAG TPA: hypothetical protein VFG53_04595 [Anaeromyxobacter sp.]|nr:hypothetical protein [Anaeromyxobacter sp.]
MVKDGSIEYCRRRAQAIEVPKFCLGSDQIIFKEGGEDSLLDKKPLEGMQTSFGRDCEALIGSLSTPVGVAEVHV